MYKFTFISDACPTVKCPTMADMYPSYDRLQATHYLNFFSPHEWSGSTVSTSQIEDCMDAILNSDVVFIVLEMGHNKETYNSLYKRIKSSSNATVIASHKDMTYQSWLDLFHLPDKYKHVPMRCYDALVSPYLSPELTGIISEIVQKKVLTCPIPYQMNDVFHEVQKDLDKSSHNIGLSLSHFNGKWMMGSRYDFYGSRRLLPSMLLCRKYGLDIFSTEATSEHSEAERYHELDLETYWNIEHTDWIKILSSCEGAVSVNNCDMQGRLTLACLALGKVSITSPSALQSIVFPDLLIEDNSHGIESFPQTLEYAIENKKAIIEEGIANIQSATANSIQVFREYINI